MSKVTAALPANRVAALGSFAVALGALVAAFIGVFPSGWQNAALALAGLLQHAPVVVTFLRGSQKWDALQSRAAGGELAPSGGDAEQASEAASPFFDALDSPDLEFAPEHAGAPTPKGQFPEQVAPTGTSTASSGLAGQGGGFAAGGVVPPRGGAQ